jgi:MOSC domain-containing protein YiiM
MLPAPDVTAGRVAHIFVAPQRGAPMVRLDDAYALAGEGLSGDRYTEASRRRSPGAQVTLIESEHIDAFARELCVAFTPDMPRRNIVTAQVALNELCGKRFRVGDAILEGVELCEPCRLFARRTHRAVLEFFVGKGGLRARIVTGGRIRVGDKISADA